MLYQLQESYMKHFCLCHTTARSLSHFVMPVTSCSQMRKYILPPLLHLFFFFSWLPANSSESLMFNHSDHITYFDLGIHFSTLESLFLLYKPCVIRSGFKAILERAVE